MLFFKDRVVHSVLPDPWFHFCFYSLQDEVHERDRFSDFLLTKLRDLLQKHPTLKLILSSAALDVNLFIRYFGSCPVIYSMTISYFL